MINIFICEDNLIQRTKLETIIQNFLLMEDLEMQIVLSTANPDEILAHLQRHPQSKSIFFLDIDLLLPPAIDFVNFRALLNCASKLALLYLYSLFFFSLALLDISKQ